MRVLVACEFSGTVRDAFALRGHDAWSCDLLPSEDSLFAEVRGHHIQGNVLNVLHDGWDLMIAHPPCTNLAVSGAKWFKSKALEQEASLTFIRTLLFADIPRIALENPISIISSRIRKPDQIIHPWQFGHDEEKTTCLWLKNLPHLQPTNVLPKRKRWKNQTPVGANHQGHSFYHHRGHERSRTYAGIASAMAEQWGVVE